MAAVLLERDGVLAALGAAVDAAREGAGGGVLVRAPAGLGKTALLREAAQRARDGATRVLTARGAELERGFAFGLARQLLTAPLTAATEDERARWLDGPAAAAAPLLLGTAPAPAADEWALIHALHWLVAQMAADGPVVLVVDDLHWGDDESLRLLAHLVHRIEGLPVAVLAATRPSDPLAAQALLDALAAEPALRVLALEPLSPDATAALVRARAADADDAACAACGAAAGGNPFLLGELLGALTHAGLPLTPAGVDEVCAAVPAGLQDLAVRRVARLGEEAVALARTVAVLGDAPPLAAAGALSGLTPESLATAEHQLASADVLSRERPLGFVHPLLRAAVLAELGPVAVPVWRRRAAQALVQAGAPDEAVAAQLLEIEPVGEPWALAALEGAARTALAQGAPATAGRLFERALAEADPDPELLVATGGALVTAGDPRGIDHMLAACDRIADDRERAELFTRAAVPMWFAGRTRELAERCRAELEGGTSDASLRFRLQAEHVAAAALGSGDRLAPIVRAALESLPATGSSTAGDRAGLGILTLPAAVTGESVETVRRLARAAVGTPEQQDEAVAAGYPMFNAVFALLLAEAPGDRAAEFRRMEDGVRRRGALALGLASAFAWQAVAHVVEGSPADAEIDARAALGFVPPAFPTAREPALAALGEALVELGRPAEALSLLGSLPQSERMTLQLARIARARALLADGRPEEALAAATEVERVVAAIDADADGAAFVAWRHVAAEALLASGDAAEAERLAAAALALAEAFGADAPVGMALRILGLATGDTALLEDAERRLATSPRRLEHARALVDLGAAWRRSGERARAREPLAAGADLAARCGATTLLERAQVELRAAGARPRSVLRTGVEALSPSEHRVAELAASGLTNREIAQRLFVSQKTVESQLRAVFRKLDIAGRAEIGVRLR